VLREEARSVLHVARAFSMAITLAGIPGPARSSIDRMGRALTMCSTRDLPTSGSASSSLSAAVLRLTSPSALTACAGP
jgi:hypothetical protein